MRINPWRSLASLPKEMWVLFTTILVNRMGTMALPFLVLYLTQNIGISPGAAGLVLVFYGVGALVTAPVAGRLSDLIGPLRVMKLSLLLSGALLIAFPLARSFTAILALALVWAVTSEAFRPANLSIVSEIVAPEQRKAAFALVRLAVNLGMSIGPAAGGFLATLSFTALFLVDGATSIAAALILAVIPWRTAQAAPAEATVEAAPSIAAKQPGAYKDRRFIYFLAGLLPSLIVFFQTQGAMPLFLVRDLGMAESVYGLLFTINTGLIILVEVPLNSAMSAWSHRLTLVLGALLCAVGFGALALAKDVLSVAATVVVWTVGEMILFPATAAYVAEIAPANRRGEYMGAYQMTFSLAFIIGPWIGIEILERFGATALWCIAFIVGLISAAIMGRAHHGSPDRLSHQAP